MNDGAVPDPSALVTLAPPIGAISRRQICGGLLCSGLIFASGCEQKPPDPIAADLGEMLMLGFSGKTTLSISARILAWHLAAKRVGGAFFVKDNVGSRDDLLSLTRLFRRDGQNQPLIGIDHEGGTVQRLTPALGFTRLPSAQTVAETLSIPDATSLYAKAAREMAAAGFNLNFAPVADLYDPLNPPIGRFGRAFSANPERVGAYATAFIDGFQTAGILCSPKHFPGHGHSREDSHVDLPDITKTWTEADLIPFSTLIGNGRAKIIMGGHLRLSTLEPREVPVTLSANAIDGLLRSKLHFEGVVLTDDLDMNSVRQIADRRHAVVQAIAAGNDLLMIKNVVDFDPFLPQNAVAWVRDAINRNVLAETRIAQSAARIRALKTSLSTASLS